MADDGLEHLPDVRRADEDSSGVGECLAPPAGELLVAAHRVLELGAVGLDGEWQAARGSHGPSEEHVIGEDEVGGCELAQDGGVGLDETVSLFLRGVLEELRLHPLVPVEDEHRQEAADVGSHRLRAAEVVELRVRLLRHDHDVVAGPAPLTRDRPCVDVGAGAAEQVAVPEKDPHGRSVSPVLVTRRRADSGHVSPRHDECLTLLTTTWAVARGSRRGESRGRRAAQPPGWTCALPRPTAC